MIAKLKPCPFCGGEAEVRYQSDLNGVRCKKCLATVAAFYTEAEAVEAWNRRAERTAKATLPDGMFYRCECNGVLNPKWQWCPWCGAKLDWSDHE